MRVRRDRQGGLGLDRHGDLTSPGTHSSKRPGWMTSGPRAAQSRAAQPRAIQPRATQPRATQPRATPRFQDLGSRRRRSPLAVLAPSPRSSPDAPGRAPLQIREVVRNDSGSGRYCSTGGSTSSGAAARTTESLARKAVTDRAVPINTSPTTARRRKLLSRADGGADRGTVEGWRGLMTTCSQEVCVWRRSGASFSCERQTHLRPLAWRVRPKATPKKDLAAPQNLPRWPDLMPPRHAPHGTP